MSSSERVVLGPTGEILKTLPSPYQPHPATGLLHFPRFLSKIRYTLQFGSLPASYRRNYKRGLDRFLCNHLGLEPDQVEAAVEESADKQELERRLLSILPPDPRAPEWNRKLVQMGMSEEGRKFILQSLEKMGVPERIRDIRSVCDLIELDEGRIPGYNPLGGPAPGFEPEVQGQSKHSP